MTRSVIPGLYRRIDELTLESMCRIHGGSQDALWRTQAWRKGFGVNSVLGLSSD